MDYPYAELWLNFNDFKPLIGQQRFWQHVSPFLSVLDTGTVDNSDRQLERGSEAMEARSSRENCLRIYSHSRKMYVICAIRQ